MYKLYAVDTVDVAAGTARYMYLGQLLHQDSYVLGP